MRRTLAALLLAFTAVTGSAAAATADTPVDVIVEDTAGTLDKNTLIPALKDIDFYEPTTVAVYTRAGTKADNFNEEVLKYARAEHPEWLSADGQKWADGLYIFALDPIGRRVGTYMGEDREVSLKDRTAIQESTYDDLRDAQWTDGVIQGVESGAEIINRPWYKSPAFKALVTGIVLISGTGTGCWLFVRARNRSLSRKSLDSGDRAYASVARDLDVTELHANTIPADSRYGAKVLEKYRNFNTKFEHATDLNNRVHAFTAKELSRKHNRQVTEEFARIARELDQDDDLIADTNALLNLDTGWERAWDRQTAALRQDLSEIDGAVSGAARNTGTAKALTAFRSEANRTLETLAADMGSGDTSPEEGLDRLSGLIHRLSELLLAHSSTVVEMTAKTQAEARMMRAAMDNSYRSHGHRGNSILDTVNPAMTYFTVASFNSGYSTGYSDVSSARRAAEQASSSSSSSSTGYGDSGGSFSGSGSSSDF